MYSSVLISKDSFKTLTVGIVSLNTQNQVHWNDMMAASTMSCIPLIILFMFPEIFIAGMTRRSEEPAPEGDFMKPITIRDIKVFVTAHMKLI